MKKVLCWSTLLTVVSLLVVFEFNADVEAQTRTPTIPHAKIGLERCFDCHQLQTLPASHAGFTQDLCLGCHSYGSATQASQSTTNSACLTCHGQTQLSIDLPSGEKLPLYIDSAVFSQSVHGKLQCINCHSNITGYPHTHLVASNRREFNLSMYELCRQCHYANYTKSLDSAHYQILEQGNLQAPICTDCHGAHNTTKPDQPRSKISSTCAKCHDTVNRQYIESVHGKALIEDNNLDVPVCNDCHPAHTFEDPRTAAFRISSVELCARCHGNAELMEKYDISTNVVRSYLQDFHGATVALIDKETKDIWAQPAVCTDCHGVHDIKQVTDPDSPVIKANLVATCAECHPDATTNFPGAWLSHYEPSFTKATLVFLVRLFYMIFIPFIVLGLLAHIFLDLWHAASRRYRR